MMKNNTRGGCAAKKGMSFTQYFPVPIFFFFFLFFFCDTIFAASYLSDVL